MPAWSQSLLDCTFYSALYSFTHLSLLKKGLYFNQTVQNVYLAVTVCQAVSWALEDVVLHEAHQSSALKELTFQRWEGVEAGVRSQT